MKAVDFALNLFEFARRTSGRTFMSLLPAAVAGMLLAQTPSAEAALSFARGVPTTVGSVRYANSPDSVIITGALTGPGAITGGLNIPANRIQYDIINSDQGPMSSWTIFYGPAVGPFMIGAYTPLNYQTSAGVIVPEGGVAYTTLFNAGYGLYTYNTGAPWSIDYEPDHITFTASTPLPANDGVGLLNPTLDLPSFAILYDPSLANGPVPATALIGTSTQSGQVYGPLPGGGTACPFVIRTADIVVETCSNCVPVTYASTVIDQCCSNVVVVYNPPSGSCLPVNTVTMVEAIASDACGNKATNHFTVTVNPGPNCPPTNCITITTSNIVVYTCNPCIPVAYNVSVSDPCCPTAAPTVTFNPPPGTCFPLNSVTTVHVTATDPCGNTSMNSFTVTVLPGPDCGNTNCITINASNIVVYTCNSCTPVPFNATAVDRCCTSGVTLTYNPPTNTCFPLNSTTPVQITAVDQCGNTATKFITVTVLPAAGCTPSTNCITLVASNIVVYTCSNCINVPFNAMAFDQCCAVGATLTYNLPATTCFPLNSSTPVQVTAVDPCGNTAMTTFTVTVLPGANCGGRPDITISGPGPAGSGTNNITISWPAPNAQLEQSMDLKNWSPVPGATNSPYVVSNTMPRAYFRLHYQ